MSEKTNILKKPDKIEMSSTVSQIHLPNQEKYHEILEEMILAFYMHHSKCMTQQDTEKHCRDSLDTCLTGFHRNGMLWKRMPGRDGKDWFEKLQKRLLVYKYDLVTKQMLDVGRKKTSKKIKESVKGKITDGTTMTIGSTERTLSPAEKDEFKRFQKEFTEAFPESVTVVDEMMIKRLAFFMVLSNRDITYVDVSKDLTKEIQMLVEALGVSGKQRNNLMSQDRNGTLELLTTKYKKTRDEYHEIEKAYKLEELKLISNQVRRDTVPEFLAMSWVKTLYGKKIDGEDLSIAEVDKFLRKEGIDV